MIEKNLDKGQPHLATLVQPSGGGGQPPIREPLALALLRRGLLPTRVEGGSGTGGGGFSGGGEAGRQKMPTVAGTFRRQLVFTVLIQ